MNEVADWLLKNLLIGPWYVVGQPEKRLFIAGLIAAALLAASFYRYHSGGWRGLTRYLLPSQWWRSASSRLDAKIFYLNFWLRQIVLINATGLGFLSAVAVAQIVDGWWPDPATRSLPKFFAAGVYTLVFFLCEDGSRFWLHRQFHRRPWLWRFHQTHHSAEVLTPLTLHRVHPLEMVLGQLRHLLVFTGVSGVALYLFKDNFSSWTILGVEVFGFCFNLLGSNLRHSHVFFGYGRWEKVLISPGQHQLHHSNQTGHCDCNFGVFLSCWDRWCGSWLPSRGQQIAGFGIGIHNQEHSLRQQILAPLLPVNRSK